VCSGADEGVCDTQCCALRARINILVHYLKSLSQHDKDEECAMSKAVDASLAKELARPAHFRTLLAAGAGAAVISRVLGQKRTSAARPSGSEATYMDAMCVLHPDVPESYYAVEALLKPGADPDFSVFIPRSEHLLQESTLLMYVVEEATNEAIRAGPNAPGITAPVRVNRMKMRARSLRTEGPSHTVRTVARA
jgi:hypothetical protein